MRAVELAKVAAQAESLRLRRLARRQSMRGVFGAVALVFAIAVLVVLHIVAYNLLARYMSALNASLILLAFDVLVAAICGYLASRNTPDAIEAEAKMVRQQALVEMKQSLTVMSVAGAAGGLLFRRRMRASGVTVVQPRGTIQLMGDLASRFMARRGGVG